METGCKKIICNVNDNCILKEADYETRIFYLKMIGDYYWYSAKTEGREKFKDSKNLNKFWFKENQKAFIFYFWDLSKLKQRIPSPKLALEFELIKCEVGTGTGAGNGFSPSSKLRRAIIFILF